MTDCLNALVSRETAETLRHFVALVERWNKRINLLSRREIGDIWTRHVLDSAQLAFLAPPDARTWLDLGSGAGFPGIVCAAIARDLHRPTVFTLVEADARKHAFLREAARSMHLPITILNTRIEHLRLPPHDVVSARALAPLDRLLGNAYPFCHSGTRLLFPKGRQADSELTLARRSWHSRTVRVPSRSDPEATIFQLSEVRPRR